jgi:hypothetical protein
MTLLQYKTFKRMQLLIIIIMIIRKSSQSAVEVLEREIKERCSPSV